MIDKDIAFSRGYIVLSVPGFSNAFQSHINGFFSYSNSSFGSRWCVILSFTSTEYFMEVFLIPPRGTHYGMITTPFVFSTDSVSVLRVTYVSSKDNLGASHFLFLQGIRLTAVLASVLSHCQQTGIRCASNSSAWDRIPFSLFRMPLTYGSFTPDTRILTKCPEGFIPSTWQSTRHRYLWDTLLSIDEILRSTRSPSS